MVASPSDSVPASTYNSFRIAVSPGRLCKHSSACRDAVTDEAIPQRVATRLRTLMPRICPASDSSSTRILRARSPSSRSLLSLAGEDKLGTQAKCSAPARTPRLQSTKVASVAAKSLPCRRPLCTLAGGAPCSVVDWKRTVRIIAFIYRSAIRGGRSHRAFGQ